jgi:hypothetical protein
MMPCQVRRFLLCEKWFDGGHISREYERIQIAHENEETTFELPAHPRDGAGADAGDEPDGVC